jgi:transposase
MQVLPTICTRHMELVRMRADADEIVITLMMTHPIAQCPNCQQWSSSIHSRYIRHLSDLPWGGVPVRIDLQVRRFRCAAPNCCHHYFTERVPEIAPPYRRYTNRLQDWLSTLALAFGGEPTSGALGNLGIQVSGDTCLRLIRDTPSDASITPRVLGVDDWAQCKGRSYGTILCDLERHCVIELLPDREAKTFSTWLESHPGIEVICRDRASAYTEAARSSAPTAQQVADRFHLLMNLTGVVKKVVERNRRCLRLPIASTLPAPPLLNNNNCDAFVQVESSHFAPSLTPHQQLVAERRARRREKYDQVVALHKLGVPGRKIASQLEISRPTVERYLRIGHYPEHARCKETIRPYTDYLIQRWEAGAKVAVQLFEEIKQQGYRGSYKAVTMFVSELKSGDLQLHPELVHTATSDISPPVPQPKPKIKSVAPRHVAHLLTKPASDLTAEQQQEVEWLCQSFPDLATAYHLAQEFGKIVRQHLPDQFADWLEKASMSGLTDFRNFVTSLAKIRMQYLQP